MKPFIKKIVTWCWQRICRHEFRLGEQRLTGIPKPTPPAPDASHQEWLDYYARLPLSDWNTKRVSWPCCKCGLVFEEHCGLDIVKHGRTIGRYHTYTATHSAWFLICPILLADLHSEAPVPLPRRFVPDWWFDFNFWLNDQAQWVISWFAPDAVGYMFYAAKELPEPMVVKVEAE